MAHRRVSRAVAAAAVLGTALLWTAGGGASSAARATACPRHDYSLDVTYRQRQGRVVVAVGVVTGAIQPCALATTIRLTARYRDRKPVRSVRGNPAAWHVAKQLQPWSALVHTWTWRNWCLRPRRQFVLTATTAGETEPIRLLHPPSCASRRAPSRLVDAGPGARLIPRVDPIPAKLLPPGTPPPVPPTLIRVTNGWLVSDGWTLVAVYAGEAGNDSSQGFFVVIRQNLVFGFQTQDEVPVGPTGAVQITTAPTGAAVETSAQRGDLGFSSSGGAHGVLHLADDRVELSPRSR